jgi:hypothetical protein
VVLSTYKNAPKGTFFEKKRQKSLLVPKKALPLHPQSREMLLERGKMRK